MATAAKFFGEHKDRSFESKSADEAARLLALQIQFERELDHKFVFAGLPLSDTIYRLLVEGLNKRAERLRADFKVPDKRWWWLKLKALAAIQSWDALEAFAKSKKSPIGYEPFVVSVSGEPMVTTNASDTTPVLEPRSADTRRCLCGTL